MILLCSFNLATELSFNIDKYVPCGWISQNQLHKTLANTGFWIHILYRVIGRLRYSDMV